MITISLNNKNKQTGLSLIELLIATSIGIFLLSGIATSYISSIKSNSNRDQYSILEDNAKIALEAITNTLEHTGYASVKSIPLENRLVKNKIGIIDETCGSHQSVLERNIYPTKTTFDNVSGVVEIGDSITNTYYGDANFFTDCSGGQLPLDCRVGTSSDSDTAKIYNTFYLDKTNNTLMCAGSRRSTAEAIAEGIENIQFLYGVDTGDDLIADRYINAKDLFDFNLQDKVISIQVAILVQSQLPVKSKKEERTYTLLDTTYKAPKDRKQRAVFTTTIRLRNTL
jgi:type IV pilus assembly protein PilW